MVAKLIVICSLLVAPLHRPDEDVVAGMDLFENHPSMSLSIDVNGEFSFTSRRVGRVALLSGSELLRSDNILAELEVVDYQRSELTKLLKDEKKQSFRVAQSVLQNRFDEEGLKGVEAKRQEYKTKLEEILMQRQLDVLKQIENRIFLRRHGFAAYFKQLSETTDFEVDRHDLEAIITLANQKSEEFRAGQKQGPAERANGFEPANMMLD